MRSLNFWHPEGKPSLWFWKRAADTSAHTLLRNVYLISDAVLAACRFRSRPKHVKLSAWTLSMLAEARLNCQAQDCQNTTLVLSDDTLSRATGQFDLVYSGLVLHTAPMIEPLPKAVCSDPEMQMNYYNLGQLMFILEQAGVQRVFSTFTSHSGTLGVFNVFPETPTGELKRTFFWICLTFPIRSGIVSGRRTVLLAS
jgi:hypothetical protein